MTTPDCTPIPDGFKRCTKCGEIKAHGEFSAAKGRKDGLASHCKSCRCEAAKRYREAHLDECRERNRQYNKRNAPRLRVLNREWKAANPDKVRAHAHRHYEANAEQVRAKVRNYAQTNKDKVRLASHRYYVEHRDSLRQKNRAYYEANVEEWRLYKRNRRARKRNAEGTCTAEDMAAIRAAQTDKQGRLICWACGKPIIGESPHLDHWIPLKHGGAHDAGNLHYMHAKCNLEKSAKMPAEIGRLI